MKKEKQQIDRVLPGKYISNLLLPKKCWQHLKSGITFALFKNRGAIFLLIYILMLLFIIGCIQNNKYIEDYSGQKDALSEPESSNHIAAKDNGNQGQNVDQGYSIDQYQNLRLELDFQSEAGSNLFRSWGDLILWSNRSLPYLVLNATLCYKDHPVNKAKYMLMQIEPGRKYSFDISKNMRIPKGEYNCILEVLGPFGLITSEKRDCLAIGGPADSIFFDENVAAEKKESNGALEQYRTEASEEKGTSKDSYANDDQVPERILRTSSAYLVPETNRDAEKSYGSEFAENSGVGGQESQDSISPDISSSRSSDSSIMAANRTDSDDQTTAAKDNNQIADQGDKEIFVGSAGSNKYHRPDCRFVAKIKNKIYYKSSEDAKKNGKVPCKTCNPP